jgi:hypothetical protein
MLGYLTIDFLALLGRLISALFSASYWVPVLSSMFLNYFLSTLMSESKAWNSSKDTLIGSFSSVLSWCKSAYGSSASMRERSSWDQKFSGFFLGGL